MAQPKSTFADRVVSWLSPVAAVRRAHARTVLAYYEAAKPDRLRKGRRATGSSNDEVLRAGSSLRQIARHLEQNYDLALGVLNTLVANTVGAYGIGIEPQPRKADGSIDDALAREIMELHKDWKKRPEVTGQHDWPSSERLLARSWFRDGEVLAQMIAGLLPTLDHGTRVPFSLEMFEADFLPMNLNTTAPARIVQGVELNAWGAPTGYHIYKSDPLEGGSLVGAQTKRLGADRVLHLKTAHRIRQVRGVSVFASVLTRFDDLKDYEESERIAAKIAASMAAFIKKGAATDYNPESGGEARRMKFQPGMVFDDLRPGEEIGMIDTNRPNPNLETYRSGQLKAIAAGAGPTYSSIARTYDGTYSAQRQELVEGYAAYAVLSAEFISRVSRPVYERFIATAVASGALKVPPGIKPGTLADATYMPPSMPWIDPKKEAEAWGMLEDRAYVSGPEIIRKRGGNPMDVLEQQGRWLREKAAEGVPVNAGSTQPAPPMEPTSPDEQ
jgi:lambda family phage portal protein